MRRLLLGSLLLSFACVIPSFGQAALALLGSDGNTYGTTGTEYGGGDQFYSYSLATNAITVLNANANKLILCLERSDGTFLGTNYASDGYPELVKVAFAGQITAVAQFPGKNDYPACPTIANDGNYYGSAMGGGNYDHGYLYQLTADGKLNVFYSFTGGSDGYGSFVSPIQASNGDLYSYSGANLLRYSPTTGLAVLPLGYDLEDYGGTLLEGPDGNFYAITGDYASVLQIQPTGKTTVIYTPVANDNPGTAGVSNLYLTGAASVPIAALQVFTYENEDVGDGCSAGGDYLSVLPLSLTGSSGPALFSIGTDEGIGGDQDLADADSYSFSLIFSGNGIFYGSVSDEHQTDNEGQYYGECDEIINTDNYSVSSGATATPITMTLTKTHVLPKGSAKLTWQVNTAFSDTMKQCFGFGGLSGPVALSGSATLTPAAAGTYVTSIVCGGTETGIATLVAGNAVLQLTASASQVGIGSSIKLTSMVTNSGTPSPTGKVTFLAGTKVIGSATLVHGTATLTASTSGVPAGTYVVTAKYAGDSNYGAATSNAISVQVVARKATTLVLTPASQTVLQGETATVMAAVAGSSEYGYPLGTVKFLLGSTVLATEMLYNEKTNSSYVYLSEETTGVPAGTYQVTASYSGDMFNLPSMSSSPATLIIQGLTPVTLTVSPNPVPADDSFTLTATVQGKDTPTGTVIFYAGGTQQLASTSVGSGGLAKVTLPSGSLPAGTYQLTAHYAGDANNPGGTSPTVTLTIQ